MHSRHVCQLSLPLSCLLSGSLQHSSAAAACGTQLALNPGVTRVCWRFWSAARHCKGALTLISALPVGHTRAAEKVLAP